MAMAAIVVQRIRCALVGEMTRDMDDAHRLYSPEDAHYSLLSLTLNQSIIRTPTLAQAGVPQHLRVQPFQLPYRSVAVGATRLPNRSDPQP